MRRISVCTGLAAFLYQFESCLTITALPVMAVEIPHLAGIISLVHASYLLAALVVIVPAGRFAARIGHHKLLGVALAVMMLGSVVCWISSDVVGLLLGRMLQGLGGGTMASTAYGLVAVCVPSEERRGVMGWIGMGAGLGMVVGTPLGGLIASVISWRALFALQLPLLLVLALIMLSRDFGHRATTHVALGLPRSILFGVGVACACLAASLGRETGWFSPPILTLQIVAVVVIGGFIWSEQKVRNPLYPREIWQARAFWPWWALLFACQLSLGGLQFLLPFYLHEAGGFSVPVAARWMLIEVACYSLAAINARRLQDVFSAERQALLGAVLTLVGTVIFATGLALRLGPVGIASGCALAGLGFGLALPAVSAGCVARLPEAFRGLGASLLPVAINLGFMTGTVATAEIREWRLTIDPAAQSYSQAFLVVLVALGLAGAGFWRGAGTKSPA